MWIDDQILEQFAKPLAIGTWIPGSPMVVLGSSNDPAVECQLENCQRDDVPVLKRYGGGGTVVLYPGCVIVSIGCWVSEHFQNDRYFRILNGALNSCLHASFAFSSGLSQNGISDLVAGDKKFGGTSMFRSRNYLLYQASLIVDCDFGLISRYLAHPSREPAYRRGRRHEDFLTGLGDVTGRASRRHSAKEVLSAFERKLHGHVLSAMGSEMSAPAPEQFPALQARIERSRLEVLK